MSDDPKPDWRIRHEAYQVVRKDWAVSPSDVICKMFSDCGCAEDVGGIIPETAMCNKVEAFLRDLQKSPTET